MHVTMQLKVPIDTATQMMDRLTGLRASHDRETKRAKDDAKLCATLAERGRRLSPNNLMRVVIAAGFEALAKVKDEELLERLAEDDVVRGRPRGR